MFTRNFFDTLVMLAEGQPWLPARINSQATTT